MLLGLIGFPVGHTLSPIMHNAALKAVGIDGLYTAFEVAPEELGRFVRSLVDFGVRGFNVTIPHKEKIIPYLDRIDKDARLIGAVNTVVVRGGKTAGYNTDGKGFISSLRKDLGVMPGGKDFFMLGAGGAARAIAFSLASCGARRIVMTDIDKWKASNLAQAVSKETRCEAIAIERGCEAMREFLLNADVFINATPCGMKASDPALLEPASLHGGLKVYDVIYNPQETCLLRDARRRGIRAANGLGMLIEQGAKSFELWTGRKAPVAVMRKAVSVLGAPACHVRMQAGRQRSALRRRVR